MVTLSITAEKDQYTWRETVEGEGCSDNNGKKELYYLSTVYKLDKHLFLDLTARPEDVCDELCRAIHMIFLVQIDKDSFTMAPIDSEWLKSSIEAKTVTLSTMSDDTDIITATPKELKAFCRKYADDKEAFKLAPGFKFSRKSAPAPASETHR